MKTKYWITGLALLIASAAFSQETATTPAKGYKYNNNFDAAFAAGNQEFSTALSWVHFHGVGKKQKFKIGYGVRYTGYTGKNKNYITAPAKLTSGQTGPQVLFTDINAANYDTINFANSQHNAINLSINLQYSFTSKFELGFNIDAVGFTFGGSQTGKFISSANTPAFDVPQTAKPTTLNALLISDNDIGSLNSELYARYWITNKLAIRAGLSFLFTEYTTNNKLVQNNDRWRYKSLTPMLGITYSPFR